MDGVGGAARDVLAMIEEQARCAEERAQAGKVMASRVAGIRGEAMSRGREVAAHVDANGRLVGIEFGSAAVGLSQQALTRATMEAVIQAQTQAATAMAQAAEEVFGSDESMTAEVHRFTGVPQKPEAVPPSPAAPTSPLIFGW